MSERRLSPVWTFADGHLLGGHRLLRRHKERFDTQRERLDETGRDSHPEGAPVAVPSEYLVTGMTFIVNNDGIPVGIAQMTNGLRMLPQLTTD